MKYLELPDNTVRILPFYLAMEEYAARVIGEESLLFMWQVAPTVIFGRNQLIENEVNLPYCREHGIATYRRKSGGGCVYADMSNIMFSYITRSDNVQTTFNDYTQAIAEMLRSLGLNASSGGRNDVLIDGMKVSGNAFYHLPGRSIVHGTMLYDTDMDHMTQAITPSHAKLASKGVSSVQSRVTTLSQHLDMGIEQFKAYARQALTDGTVTLTAADVEQIEQIMQEYLTPTFILGHNPQCTLQRECLIDGVGSMCVSLELKSNRIKHINIAGDYFLLSDIDQGLFKPLRGVEFSPTALTEALRDVDVSTIIMNLSTNKFINILTN